MMKNHPMPSFLFCVAAFILIIALAACGHVPAGGTAGTGDLADSSTNSILMDFYRGPLNHLNGVRRGSCPMHPSCSEYSRQALAAHGAVIGWTMALDRLLRCGRNEIQNAPKILVDGQWKYFDPLEANDYWWYNRTKNYPDLPKARQNALPNAAVEKNESKSLSGSKLLGDDFDNLN